MERRINVKMWLQDGAEFVVIKATSFKKATEKALLMKGLEVVSMESEDHFKSGVFTLEDGFEGRIKCFNI